MIMHAELSNVCFEFREADRLWRHNQTSQYLPKAK